MSPEEKLEFLDGILANDGSLTNAGVALGIESDRFWEAIMADEGFARAVTVALLAAQGRSTDEGVDYSEGPC